MKNFILLLLTALILVSCDDSVVNEFAMQANIGDEFYKSNDARGIIAEDGGVIIEGMTELESLTLQLSSLAEGTYTIGRGSPNSAIYKDFDGNLYHSEPDGFGVVTISKVNQIDKTVTGTFHFSAILPGVDTVYVSRGVIYNVSYDGAEIGGPSNAGTFSAKVDNNLFTPSIVTAVESGSSIKISGSTITSKIALVVPSNVQVGEYILPLAGYTAEYQDQTGVQPTTEGKITITEHNTNSKSIKGSFSFLTNQSEITEGEFEVVYQ